MADKKEKKITEKSLDNHARYDYEMRNGNGIASASFKRMPFQLKGKIEYIAEVEENE